MKNIYINNVERPTERARAITAAKKASAKKKRMIISVVSLTLVLIASASFMIIGITNKPAAPAKSTLVSKTTMAPKTAAQPAASALQQAATAVQEQPAANQETYETAAPAQQTSAPAQQTAVPAQQTSEDRIDEINGERVYIDTKRTAPEGSGTPLHFYANGKTSYGFDWTYNTDNCNFVLRCDYNFDQQQYDFQFYGVTPGTANVTVYYNTDDNTQVPVNMTINVDNDLNVTQV